jgi:hypothetical protein
MLPILISIDTEYSSGLYRSGAGRDCDDNFVRCIKCTTKSGPVGIGYQMDVFDRHQLKGVFFVDPMPALVWGTDAIRRVVGPILEGGHDVQLHLHTEWLEFAERNPLGTKSGKNLADFSLSDQRVLIGYAMEQLMLAGAPAPIAFRAGNYGANDDTLTALNELGMRIDTSFPSGLERSACTLTLGPEVVFPQRHCGTIELPIGAIAGRGDRRRHGQLTAMSFSELRAMVNHSLAWSWPALVLVSHSFEMMNRRRGTANRIVQRRFERFCEWLAGVPLVRTTDFRDEEFVEQIVDHGSAPSPGLLPHRPARTLFRMAEQLASNVLYG